MPTSSTVPVLAIIAALPREVAALVRGTAADPELLSRGIHRYQVRGAIVVAAGMGAQRAAIAVEAALAASAATRVTTLISTGLAGACTAELHPGEVAEVDLVIDSRTGERFTAASGRGACTLVTAEAIASVQEKARLAASYGAALVDMEAATVARLAAAHGFPFRAVKGISDAHDFELASLSRFAGKHGRFRAAAFAMHTALRPLHWSPAARLGRDSNRALSLLTACLQEIIASAGAR